jgi:Ca2+-binding RTX toxin-like protein
MATVNFYQSINMSNPRIFYGYVTNATSSSITINDYMGQSGTYNGSFSYSGNNLAGGTVTGYQSVDNYSLSATVTGVSVNALTLKSYLDTGNALGLYQYALSGADQITGSSGSDTLLGFNGNDTINGGNGADNLYGGLGNDTYVVDNTSDVVTENVGAGTDTVNSTITYTLTANVEKLTLTGAVALKGTGNGLNNTLIGNAAANTLNGLAGADKMTGGLGNDTYYVDNIGDVVTETSALLTEIDTVYSAVSYALGANLENLILTGTAANGTGNALANSLTGDAAANRLDGGAGADNLSGSAGNDALIGDTGNDWLTGGLGSDIFVFNTALNATTNKDTITDFNHTNDTIHLYKTVMSALGSAGTLSANNFKLSTQALDSSDRITYNVNSGALSYDADGSGTTASIQIALIGVTTHPSNIDYTDFVIV